MKYEKPELKKLSDFSHHLCYGLCSTGNNPSGQGVGKCEVGAGAQGRCTGGNAV